MKNEPDARRNWVIGALLATLCLPALATRPDDLADFDAAVVCTNAAPAACVDNGDSPMRLDETTRNLIQYGCAQYANGACVGPEADTYMFFPSFVNSGGNARLYLLEPMTIDRTTSLFLIGGDQNFTKLAVRYGSLASHDDGDPETVDPECSDTTSVSPTTQDPCNANPGVALFTVENAGLINVSNMTLSPDVGFRVRGTDGVPAFRIENDTSAVDFEMLDTRLQFTKVKIEGPGEYRFQNVSGTARGRVDSIIEVNHSAANLTVVGGILVGNDGITQIPGGIDTRIVTSCVTDDSAAECQCADPDFCTVAELDAMAAICTNDPDHPGCPGNPCGCQEHLVWQKDGNVEIYTTAFIADRGTAAIRLERAGGPQHILANIRSEGPKCGTNYPPTIVDVPPTPHAVDVALVGSNLASGGTAVQACPTGLDPFGSGRFMDYNGTGEVWLAGNLSMTGAGRIATGVATGATIVASGNHYFGNPDSGGADPENLLPMTGRRCAASPNPSCFDDDDCPTSACEDVALDPDPVIVSNTYSYSEFCNDIGNGATGCSCAVPGACPTERRHVNSNGDDVMREFDSIPDYPILNVPDPIEQVLVPDLTGTALEPYWVDATDFQDGSCDDCPAGLATAYYPDGCSPAIPSPACWIQAALNRGWAEAKPVFIPADNPLSIGTKTLYWFHRNSKQFDCPWGTGICGNWIGGPPSFITKPRPPYPGGWIAGENNHVEISTTLGSAFASEGFAHGTLQGISFTTIDGSATVVDIENYYDSAAPGSVGPNTVHVALHGVSTSGGRIGVGMCIDSPTQCDTMMTVGGTFSGAHIGWGAGGWNALHNIAYDGSFVDNDVAIGHDPIAGETFRCHGDDPAPAPNPAWQDGDDCTSNPNLCPNNCVQSGYGNWSMLKGSIQGDGRRDRDFELFGGHHPILFHDVDSNNRVATDLISTNPSQVHTLHFDDVTWTNPTDGDIVKYNRSGPVVFSNSDFGAASVDVSSTSSVNASTALKIASFSTGWSGSTTDANSEIDEFEVCPPQPVCNPCSGGIPHPYLLGDGQCLNRSAQAWLAACNNPEGLEAVEAMCIGGGAQTCSIQSLEVVCP